METSANKEFNDVPPQSEADFPQCEMIIKHTLNPIQENKYLGKLTKSWPISATL